MYTVPITFLTMLSRIITEDLEPTRSETDVNFFTALHTIMSTRKQLFQKAMPMVLERITRVQEVTFWVA